jgi:MoxR-vWA-beta-propeller ternary system domain bpX2
MLLLNLALLDMEALGPHRTKAGWEICELEGSLWVRGTMTEQEVSALPCLGKFRIDGQGRIIPLGRMVPVGTAPAGPWQSLGSFLTVAAPSSGMPGRTRARLEIRLQRSQRAVPAASILLGMRELAAWVERAPKVRLDRLTFAASTDGRALVIGTPLPPVPGVPHYRYGSLAIACGWEFAPEFWPGWVERALAPGIGAVALVLADGSVEVIGQEGFTPLTLAAVRRTMEPSTAARDE